MRTKMYYNKHLVHLSTDMSEFQYVSEVVIGAPYTVTEALLKHLKVDVVCRGRGVVPLDVSGRDPYDVPKKLGIFRLLNSQNEMTTSKIISRIIEHRWVSVVALHSTMERRHEGPSAVLN